MAERMRPKDVLADKDFRPFNEKEVRRISDAYGQILLAGLRGEPTDLAMNSSLLKPVNMASIPDGKSALVIEIGGSNVYGARYKMLKGQLALDFGTKTSFGKSEFDSPEDFLKEVLSKIDNVVNFGGVPDALGVIFSFPGDALKQENGVDVISEHDVILSKELHIPIGKNPVASQALHILSQTHSFPLDLPRVTTNDTIAVALSVPSQMGIVCGTGFNISILDSENNFYVSTESARFNDVPTHRLARLVDDASNEPGRKLAEKQISGKYLGQQFALATGSTNNSSERITQVLKEADGSEEWKIAQILRERSGQLTGILTGTVIKVLPKLFSDKTVTIPVEGSVFWGMTGHAGITKATAENILENSKKVNFVPAPHGGRAGVALAALGYVK